jgi:selenocysteine-specific elongation factor
VKLNTLSNLSHQLKHGATVSFFVGAAEVLAKIHLLDKEELSPGDTAWAQFALDQPVAAVKGDHFIIRSPMDTLGGGIIINAHAKRHRRYRSEIITNLEAIEKGTAADTVTAALEMKQPMELHELQVQCNLSKTEAYQIVSSLIEQKHIIQIGRGDNSLLFTSDGWERLTKKAESVVQDFHRKYPTRPGIPKGELSSKLGLPPHSPVLQMLFTHKIFVEEDGNVRLPSYTVQLNSGQQEKVDNYLRALNQNPYAPPGDIVLETELLNMLIEQQKVVKVADGVVFARPVYDEMVRRVLDRAREKGTITLAEVRDMFNTSRKYVTALLEYMDEKKLTRRVGDARVVR